MGENTAYAELQCRAYEEYEDILQFLKGVLSPADFVVFDAKLTRLLVTRKEFVEITGEIPFINDPKRVNVLNIPSQPVPDIKAYQDYGDTAPRDPGDTTGN